MRRLVLVVIGVWVAVAALAGVLLQPKGTGDAYQHLDYIYQLSRGIMPAPFGHLWDPADFTHKLAGRQYASAHPPLYPAMMAFLVGGLLDTNWPLAVAIIRTVNVVIGASGIAAMAWLGWQFPSSQRARIAVGMAALGGASFTYVRFGAEVYLDALVMACAAAALALAALILRRGLTPARLATLAVICTVGMGTKATFIATLFVVAAAVCLSPITRPAADAARRWTGAVVGGFALIVAAITPWWWFYRHNAELSGSWYRSVPKIQVGNRTPKALLDVLSSNGYWLNVPSKLLGSRHGMVGDPRFSVAMFLFVTLAAGSLFVAVSTVRKRLAGPPKQTTRTVLSDPAARSAPAIVAMLAVQLGAAHAMQLSHAVGYGQFNPRYYLVAAAPLALLTGYGIAVWRRRAVAIPLVLAVIYAWIIQSVLVTSRGSGFRGLTWAEVGVPDVALAWVLEAAAAGGLVLLGVLLHRYRSELSGTRSASSVANSSDTDHDAPPVDVPRLAPGRAPDAGGLP